MPIKLSKSSLWMVLSTVSAIAATTLGCPQSSHALPATNAQPLQDLFPTKDNTDPFSSRGDGSAVFDLIHRANLGPSRSLEDFSSEQQKNLTDAAAQFRAKQRQILQQQAPTQPSDGIILPSDSPALAPQ